ncbi:MAG: response regulator [Verrucomicrobia bacterium]|nr:response regulator [Verrucomicrobiota bacterium]
MEKKRILLVDDDIAFTRMMKLNLERNGTFDIHVENSGSRAVATAKEFKPQLILLDVIMPEVDGGDVAAMLKDDPTVKDIPVVFITALVSGEENASGGLIRSGYRFIGKLASEKEMLQCIEENIR